MEVEKRLKKLEWTNRLLFALVLLLAGNAAIGHVHAQASDGKIVAESVETHSLTIDNPYGKQGVTMDVGDSGMVGFGMNDVNGKESIGLLSTSSGEPSVCLAYEGTCRVVLGEVYRGDQRELSIQLRDKNGKSIWMPPTANVFTPTGGK